MTVLHRNAIANIAGRLATAVIWISVTPFVLTVLGKEGFGIWSLFFAFNNYLLSLDLGVGNTMLRFIAAHRPSGDRRALARTLRFGIGAAVGLGLVWAVLIAILRGWIVTLFHVPESMVPETMSALLTFAIGVQLMFPAQVLMASLRGFERLDLSNLCMVFGVIAQVVILIVALSAGAGIEGAAIAGAVGQGFTALLAALLVGGQMAGHRPGGSGTIPGWRDLTQFSTAFQLLGLLIVLQHYSGRILLGLLGNLTMVAEYELALRVSFAVYALPILIQSAVVPTVARVAESEGPTAVEALYASTSRWIYLITALTLGSLWLMAPDVARVWLGPGHERIADLIRLSVIAYVVCLAYSPGVAVARGLGRPGFEIASYAAAAVSHIGLAIWWVPRFGTAGVLYAAIASFAVGFVVFTASFHRSCRIPLRPWLMGQYAPRAVAGLLVVVCSAGLLAAGKSVGLLPSPGWAHGAVAGLCFVTLFALFFVPLGDTQRMSTFLWQMTAGALLRRRHVRTS